MVTLRPSNGGERVYVGGFDPAPENVMTTLWRSSICVGAAQTRLGMVAKSRVAATVVNDFMLEVVLFLIASR